MANAKKNTKNTKKSTAKKSTGKKKATTPKKKVTPKTTKSTTKKPATKKPSIKKVTTTKNTKKTTKKSTVPKGTKKPSPKKTTGKTTAKSTTRAKKTTDTTTKSSQTKTPTKKSTKKEALVLVPVVIKTHYDSKGGHPHVIVADVNEKHVSVGLTSDKFKGKNSPNYKLKVNPLGGSEQSYMKRQGTVESQSRYYNERKGVMHPEDKKKANQYGAKALVKHNKGEKRK